MKKVLLPLLLISPLLLGMTKQENAENTIFEMIELSLEGFNSRSITVDKTTRGYLVNPAESYSTTDAFIRFMNLTDVQEVSIKNNNFLAIRYRSNYDPELAIRILSTTGSNAWSDFLFDSYSATTISSFSNWNTVVFELSFEHARNTTKSIYDSWVEGDYSSLSINVTNNELFNNNQNYLYLSSFSFFKTYDEASSFKGLPYSQVEDTSGPIISVPNVDGDTIITTYGRKFNLSATYYDEYDDLGGVIEGALSEGALNDDGLLTQGSHTITFTASDLSNNVTTKVFNIIANEKDTIAPVIYLNVEKLYVLAGSFNKLVFEAYDEVDGKIECKTKYSVGALNSQGQFLAGNHTLTITASDLSGNEATKTVEIISGYDLNPDGLEVIDEGEN